MLPTPYVASLQSLRTNSDSFEPADQLRWNQILVTSPTGWDEQNRALKRTILSESPSLKADGAHILEHDGIKSMLRLGQLQLGVGLH
jgi:hypothetical protein